MSTTTRPRSSRNSSLTCAAKGRFGIYPNADGGVVLVACEDQLRAHDESKPCAICVEAGLGRTWWLQSEQRYAEHWPWLAKYLYHIGPWRADAGLEKTDSMLAFREHSTSRAILKAAERPKERRGWRKDYVSEIPESMLSYWRRKIRRGLARVIPKRRRKKLYLQYDRWQVRGEDLPTNWTVLTAEQYRRVARWLDFAAHCAGLIQPRRSAQRRRRSKRSRASSYVLWIGNKIPDLGCLKWLFGFPRPDGVYFVSEALTRLKHEKGRKGILAEMKRRGNHDDAILWRWENDERTAGPIKSILAGGKGEDSASWEQMDEETRRQMKVVEEVVSLDDCLRRADLSRAQYFVELREAEDCDAKELLLAYLASEGRFAPPGKKVNPQDKGKRVGNRRCGLVAPNFFIPTHKMWRFRERAEEEAAKQRVWELTNLPGFDHWFADWAAPKGYRGRRFVITLSGESPTPPTAVTNRRQSPDQTRTPTPALPLNGEAQPSATEKECDKQTALDGLASTSKNAPPATKRSTQKGEARDKIIAALTEHHKYADGGCLNFEPIGNNGLARLAGVSESTASAFFNDQFQGHNKYKALCQDTTGLLAALKLLNNEFAPHNLYGRRPPHEGDRDDEGDE
jgi:hypothetical protein